MAATGWYGAKRSRVIIRIAMPQIMRMRKKT
jgi:ABC-type arginine transport system permease subunit